MEVQSLKEGNRRELRRLYDVLLQHYQTIKAMDQDNFGGMLLMAMIALKVGPTTCTMRDRQRSSREHKEVPPFADLLDFIDLQVSDTENSVRDVVEKHPTASYPGKRMTKSYTPSVEDICMACKKDNHPLYGCKSSIALSPRTVVCASVA